MYDVITIGGATLDIFMKDSEFEVSGGNNSHEKICMNLGDKLLVDDVYFTYGGGGMNTAASLSRLGLKTAYVGVIGDDEIGHGIKTQLNEKHIDDRYVSLNPNAKSGLSVALHAGKRERTILAYRGANDSLELSVDQLTDIFSNTPWVYLSHLSGKSDICINRIADVLKNSTTQIMWNPGSTQLKGGVTGMKSLLEKTMIINVNKEEAELLTGISVPRNQELDDDLIDDVSVLFDEIAEMGPQIIVITDGKRGAAVWEGGRIFSSKNYNVNSTNDTTGAGDAFGSGFCAGYILTQDIKSALAWGVVQGGAVITEFGAQNGLLDRKRLEVEVQKKNTIDTRQE